MSDFILVDGDIVTFIPAFGTAVVVVQPGKLSGSGPATANGKKLCVVGDERNVSVPGCKYMTPQYSIPGAGTLQIDALAGNQQARKTKTGNKAVMLKGAMFTPNSQYRARRSSPRQARDHRFPIRRPSIRATACL